MKIYPKLTAALLCLIIVAGLSKAEAHGPLDFLHNDYLIGSGELETVSRDLGQFSSIEANGSFDLFITCGEKQSLALTIDENLLDLVETDVRHGVLTISSRGSFSADPRSRIEISLPTLEMLELSGSGDIVVYDAEGEEISFKLIGSGEIDLRDVEVNMMTVAISGSGSLRADGNTEELDVRLSGSGNIDLSDVRAADATVRVSGSGDVRVFVSGHLNGRISGSGDIHYSGNPEQVSRNISGSGDIRRKR